MPGEGSVFQRTDGRWVATISQGPRGSRKVTTAYRHTKGEALDALGDLRRRSGRLDAGTLTVGSYLERWLRDARDLRPATRRGYQAVLTTHLDPAIGHLRLATLSPLHVDRMLTDLAPTMAPKTLRNALIVLRRALTQAVRHDLIQRNVASREYIDAPKVTPREPDALTDAELDRLLATLPGDPIEAHVLLALGTGLRQGEQLGLGWEDVEGRSVRVTKALARIDGQYEPVEPKTDRSIREVPMSPTVRAALDAHKARLEADGWVLIATGPVFPNTTGGDMSGSVLTHRWYRLLERAGIRRRPWKILRATYGSQLHAAGLDDMTIAALLGHARTHTTKRHYISARPADTTAAIEAVLRRTA